MAALGLHCCLGFAPVAMSERWQSAGFSLWRPLLLQSPALGCMGFVAAAHKLSCFTLCGIFLDQGSEPCPLHWRRILNHQTLPGKSLSDCLQGGICGVLTLEHVQDWGHGGGARLGREERWLHTKVQPSPPTMLWCPAPRSPEIPDLSLTFQVVFTVSLVKVKG